MHHAGMNKRANAPNLNEDMQKYTKHRRMHVPDMNEEVRERTKQEGGDAQIGACAASPASAAWWSALQRWHLPPRELIRPGILSNMQMTLGQS